MSLRTTPLASRWSCHASRSARVGTPSPRWSSPVRRLAEQLVLVGVVAVQHDHERERLVGEQLHVAALVRSLHLERDAEHVRVPVDAGVEVGDGEGDVMLARTGGVPMLVSSGGSSNHDGVGRCREQVGVAVGEAVQRGGAVAGERRAVHQRERAGRQIGERADRRRRVRASGTSRGTWPRPRSPA